MHSIPIPNEQQLTMSSLEIAELTAKEHRSVLRDTRRMLEQLQMDAAQFCASQNYGNNNQREIFNLPKDLTLTLITGYSTPIRHKINKRWLELEGQNSLTIPNFSDPAEAAIAWAEQYKRSQLAESTKAEIGTRREATAMNTASQAIKKANKLEIELDKSKDYCTIKRMTMLKHGQHFDWRLLKSTGNEMNIPALDVFDANYGTVKAYHRDVWKEAYAIDLDEADFIPEGIAAKTSRA